MKHFKVLLLLITLSSVSNASFLLDRNNPLCIEDYYVAGNALHFQRSNNLNWISTGEDHSVGRIYNGYVYDSTTNSCEMGFALKNGMTYEQFNFLLGLIGVIIGGIFMYFSVKAFVAVGGKR